MHNKQPYEVDTRVCEEIAGMEGQGSKKKTGDEGQKNVREVSRWSGLGLGFCMGLIVLSKKNRGVWNSWVPLLVK